MAKHYKIRLNFLGKDSVPYDNVIEVPKEIWEQYQKLVSNAGNKEVFKHADSGSVAAFLQEVQKGITPKMCRTVVCNETLIKNLKTKTVTKDSKESEKLRAIFEANLEIAKTLNHQKNVSKNQKEAELKIKERVAKTKERIKILKSSHKEKLLKLDEKAAKYKVAFKGQRLLQEKLAEINEAKIKLTAQMERAKANIEKAELALDKKQLTKNIALGTSLGGYADFRVVLSYCKSIDLPIEKVYSASQLKNFDWGMDVDENFWKNYPSF